ncbi:MAG TPA: 3-isopropylmalate dehydratase small subunit [Candidatus Aquilonibacter sp.]
MQPFDRVIGAAAPLLNDDINTDQIAPAVQSFKPDYAELLFARWRRSPEGVEFPGFVLNRAPFRQARVLVARENFGSGSSRESAVWALLAFGIRVVVARSFADIFRENCLKNGLLPIVLAGANAAAFEAAVVADDGASPCTVDLRAQTIEGPGPQTYHFSLAAAERDALLRGLDDIGLTLEALASIVGWENQMARKQPWLQQIPNGSAVWR